jgi:hypothetical protein
MTLAQAIAIGLAVIGVFIMMKTRRQSPAPQPSVA